ncbi:hypothetical protein Tco_1572791 [Tanacetum coccineum]
MSKHRVVDVHYADHISAYTRSGNALKEDRYDVYDRFDRMSGRKGSGLREHLERRVEDGSFFKGMPIRDNRKKAQTKFRFKSRSRNFHSWKWRKRKNTDGAHNEFTHRMQKFDI